MFSFFGFIVDQTQRIEEMTNASESKKVATTSAASPIAVVIKPDAMKKISPSPGALADSSASSNHSSQQQQSSELKGKAKFANFMSKMIKSTSFKVLTFE